MPTPDDQTQFVELNDFSQGIHSEFHGTNTASSAAQGSLLGNGIAQVDGTFGCHADKAGSLIPLPRAQSTGLRDYIRPTAPIDLTRPFRYVLDAQVGSSLVDGTETEADAFPERVRTPVHMMWATSIDTTAGPRYVIHGREYRPWIDFPHANPASLEIGIIDFLTGFIEGVSTEFTPLPIGSLTKSRFYYGFTEPGGSETTFTDPLLLYPVVVAMAASPWIRWGEGNRFDSSAIANRIDVSLFGTAPYPKFPGGGPHNFAPAIGANGEGTCIVCMQLNDDGSLNLPFHNSQEQRWLFHYDEVDNAPQNDLIADIAGGPLNPYMILSFQNRLIIPDRRRSRAAFASLADTLPDHGFIDDLVFFSESAVPLQSSRVTPLSSIKGVTLAVTHDFPIATYEKWNPLLVAEDLIAEFGTVGVITVDQLLLIKHFGGGALLSGDLADPTVTRLPYIESTGGIICKGTNTPIGFVYGSNRGIFLWQGGDTSDHISPQLDGFFWDHTQGSTDEIYAGSRGRMAYWNRLIWVPNNYVYDADKQSWWRVGLQKIAESYGTPPPHFELPGMVRVLSGFGNSDNSIEEDDTTVLTNVEGLTQLDIRVAISNIERNDDPTQPELQQLVSLWNHSSGSTKKSWGFHLRSFSLEGFPDRLGFQLSTDGSTESNHISDLAITNVSALQILRATWRSSDGRVQFFRKNPSIGGIDAAIVDNTGWTQIGADKTGPTSALFDPTGDLPIRIATSGATGTINTRPFNGHMYALTIADTIDADPVLAWKTTDVPDDLEALTMGGSGTVANTWDIIRDADESLTIVHDSPASTLPVAYNCYDVDSQGILYAFPYRHAVGLPSHATIPSSSGNNFLSIPDAANISAPSQLDIRFIIGDFNLAPGTFRTIVSHFDTNGDNRSYLIRLNESDQLEFITNTDGTAATNIIVNSTAVFSDESGVLIGRVTWRSSDGRVQFFDKAVGDFENRLLSDVGWVQIGTDETAATAALHDSTEDLRIGLDGADAWPLQGDVYALTLATTINADPVFALLPGDWPSDTSADTFTADTDQTVTVTRATTGAQLALNFTDLAQTPSAWYTFTEGDLETSYSWTSHPILESIDQVLSWQTVEVVATGNPLTNRQTVTITLFGYNEAMKAVPPVSLTLTLAQASTANSQPAGPQILRNEFPSFNAQHVRVKIEADDADDLEAPKIHGVRLGYMPRFHTPRNG